MKKINTLIVLILLPLLFSGCGYKKLNDTNLKNIYIENINFTGDKRIAYSLKNELMLISYSGGENIIKLDLLIEKNKTVKSKDKQARPTKYDITLLVDLNVKDNKNKEIFKRLFSKTISYDVAKNHSDTVNIEKINLENITDQIAEEIVEFINFYFRN
tara:strand:- start:1592 stop:2065 length:474 start_codon:yes stop_codon:yes gene_type:complete